MQPIMWCSIDDRIICPHCGEDRQIEVTDRPSKYVIRRPTRIVLYYWFCSVCGREFLAPSKTGKT